MERRTRAAAGSSPKRRCCDPPPAIDRLSALPDSLLLHILSFLHMKDAVCTAFVSRRWRHLWTSTSCLDFCWVYGDHTPAPGGYFTHPNFIDRALILHGATKIKAFRAVANHFMPWENHQISELAKRVDSWVRFALRRGVEELKLDCCFILDHQAPLDPIYVLPDCIFTSKSLVSLDLRFCQIKLYSRPSLTSLKTLALFKIELKDEMLDTVLVGCPVLKSLAVMECNVYINLTINAERASPHLKTLKICNNNYPGVLYTKVLILAPNITTFILDGQLRPGYDMKDVSSIATVSLNLSFMFTQHMIGVHCRCLDHLLNNLRHVKVLKLSSCCIQVLSIRASENSELPSDFNITSLELTIGFIACEFPGIFFALRSFTNLEFLTIDMVCENKRIKFGSDISGNHCLDEANYDMANERCSPNMLQHLKTVNIFGLVRTICEEEENKTVEEILKKYQNGFEFIRFLLKNSPVLERLAIIGRQSFDKLTKNSLKVLFKLSSLLLTLPRASPDALVIIQDK